MSLIPCSECGNQVSDKAGSCPRCGCPIATAGAGTDVQAIEQTAKRFKLWQLFGAMLTIGGCITTMGGEPDSAAIGASLFMGGLICFLAARMAAWWHHG